MTRPVYKYNKNWEIAVLEPNPQGEIVIEATSGSTPSTEQEQYWGGTIPWLTPKDVTEKSTYRYVTNTSRTITQKGLEESSAKQMSPDTVMLTKRAPVGDVVINKVPMATNQGFLNFRCGKKLMPEFLYYWFKANREYLYTIANGSVYPELYQSDLFEFEIGIPSVQEQQIICNILGSLDDKIQLNLLICHNIEKVIQSLYKSWFVDYEPVHSKIRGEKYFFGIPEELFRYISSSFIDSDLGPIPEDWCLDVLDNVCHEITDGSHFSPEEYPAGNEKIATIRNMNDFGIDIDSCKPISNADYKLLVKNGCRPENGDVLFSKDGTIGITFVYNGDKNLVLLSSIAILRANNRITPHLLKYCLKDKRTQQRIQTGYKSGSALRRVILKDLKQVRIVIPTNPFINKFNQYAKDLCSMQIEKLGEISILERIRDVLLPNLIAGKLKAINQTRNTNTTIL